MRNYYCYLSVVFVVPCMMLSMCFGQSSPTRGGGAFDSDIPIPLTSGVLGQQDASAMAEVAAHLAVVGNSPWTGMQGSGQIRYGTSDQTIYPATLSILGGSSFRLDSQTAQGGTSIRISRRYGKIQSADGQMLLLPPNTAESGLFQFELPRLTGFPNPSASLIDHGLNLVGGMQLRRLTYEFLVGNPSAKNKETVVTDLYFDPSTKLLIKSSNAIRLNGANNTSFLRVITYDDYRLVSGAMIPFRYTQTLDGQKQWTLQLTTAQLNPALNATSFQF